MADKITDQDRAKQFHELRDSIIEQDLRHIEDAMGTKIGSLDALEKSFGEGMKLGNVTFVSKDGSEDGVFGHLHYLTTEDGKKVTKDVEVTNITEAGLLQNLQNQANKER